MQHFNNAPWSQKKKWRLLWTLILGTPHIGANVTVTLSLVPITMHLPPSLQVSQSATQCIYIYHDTKMLKCVQHSLRSAMCSELPTATFLFLPNWENKSINAYRALVRDNPKYCTTLGFIPKTKLTYAMPTSWKGVQRNFSNHTWSINIIAVWNKEAIQHLTDASQNWLQTLQRSIPEAVWGKKQYLAREDTDHITNHVCPQYFKSKREDVTGQERV